MQVVEAVVRILLSLYEPVRKALEAGAPEERVRAALSAGLDVAFIVARSRIESQAGAPVAQVAVLATRAGDVADAFREAGFAAEAEVFAAVADRLRSGAA